MKWLFDVSVQGISGDERELEFTGDSKRIKRATFGFEKAWRGHIDFIWDVLIIL